MSPNTVLIIINFFPVALTELYKGMQVGSPTLSLAPNLQTSATLPPPPHTHTFAGVAIVYPGCRGVNPTRCTFTIVPQPVTILSVHIHVQINMQNSTIILLLLLLSTCSPKYKLQLVSTTCAITFNYFHLVEVSYLEITNPFTYP